MSNDYFQNSLSRLTGKTPGLVDKRVAADISPFRVETAAGIGYGVVVSRGTSTGKQIVVGGTAVVGVTVRPETSFGDGSADLTNPGIYSQYKEAGVMRRGYIRLACTGTASAGSRLISYNTTTGAIVLGAPGSGEARIYGLTLEEDVTTADANGALFRVDDPRDVTDAAVGFVTDVTVNGTSVVSAGTAVISAVTSLTVGEETDIVGDVEFVDDSTAITIVGSATGATVTIGDQI